jgi:hypothetical protein
MFVFNRPFRAVAAGLGVALLTVCVDRACEPPADLSAAAPVAVHATQVADAPDSACAAPAACGIVRAGS